MVHCFLCNTLHEHFSAVCSSVSCAAFSERCSGLHLHLSTPYYHCLHLLPSCYLLHHCQNKLFLVTLVARHFTPVSWFGTGVALRIASLLSLPVPSPSLPSSYMILISIAKIFKKWMLMLFCSTRDTICDVANNPWSHGGGVMEMSKIYSKNWMECSHFKLKMKLWFNRKLLHFYFCCSCIYI